MALIVADSDVLIDALRGRSLARERIARALEAQELVTTCVTLFEPLSVHGNLQTLERFRYRPVVRFGSRQRSAPCATQGPGPLAEPRIGAERIRA